MTRGRSIISREQTAGTGSSSTSTSTSNNDGNLDNNTTTRTTNMTDEGEETSLVSYDSDPEL